MEVNYFVRERIEPGVTGGGNRKYYAAVKANDTIDIYEFAEVIEKMSALTEIEVHGVLIALTSLIPEYLADGYIVKLGDFGSFRLSITSEGVESPEKVTRHLIKKSRIIYHPGKRMKRMLKKINFRKRR